MRAGPAREREQRSRQDPRDLPGHIFSIRGASLYRGLNTAEPSKKRAGSQYANPGAGFLERKTPLESRRQARLAFRGRGPLPQGPLIH